jgi:uncharacterized membrane protein HdeD (DUF308 family)
MDSVTAEVRKDWWMPVVLGIASVLFGFAALIWPGLTIGVMAALMAILFAVYGIVDIVVGIKRVKIDTLTGVLTVLLGVLQLGIAVYLFHHRGSGLTIALFVLLIAIGFIVRGVIGVFSAFSSEVSSGWRWVNVILGLLYIIAGIYIINYPVQGSLAFVWVLGLLALITGPLYIALGLELKDSAKKLK